MKFGLFWLGLLLSWAFLPQKVGAVSVEIRNRQDHSEATFIDFPSISTQQENELVPANQYLCVRYGLNEPGAESLKLFIEKDLSTQHNVGTLPTLWRAQSGPFYENQISVKDIEGWKKLSSEVPEKLPLFNTGLTCVQFSLQIRPGILPTAYATTVRIEGDMFENTTPVYPDGISEFNTVYRPHEGPFEIPYTLSETAHVSLSILDRQGNPLKTLISETKEKGKHFVVWDGSQDGGGTVRSGVYRLYFKSGKERKIKNIVVIR